MAMGKDMYHQVSNIRQLNCWSLRCSWSIACRHCSNYIFILNLTPGFNGLLKDNCKKRRESFKYLDLLRLILETWRYFWKSKRFDYCDYLTTRHVSWLLSKGVDVIFELGKAIFWEYSKCYICYIYIDMGYCYMWCTIHPVYIFSQWRMNC